MIKDIQPKSSKCSIRLIRNRAKCSIRLIRFSRYLIEEFCELRVLYHENFAFKSKGSTRIQRKHAKNAFFAIKSMHLGPFSRHFGVILACFCAFECTEIGAGVGWTASLPGCQGRGITTAGTRTCPWGTRTRGTRRNNRDLSLTPAHRGETAMNGAQLIPHSPIRVPSLRE
jgi:hypothetical protein